MNKLRALSLLLAALLLASCTAKLSYSFIDVAIAWRIDDYIDWTSEQEREFERALAEQILWHRTSELPRYVQLLGEMKAVFAAEPDRAKLLQLLVEVEASWQNILVNITPDTAELLAQLDDKQVAELLANVREEITEDEEEYLDASPDELHKKRVKRVEKFTARYIGRLNDDQKQLIDQWSRGVVDTRQSWLANRRQWADNFEAALTRRAQPGLEAQLLALFNESNSLGSEEYQRAMEQNYNHAVDMILALQKSLTEKQQRELQGKLDYWKDAFSDLAAS